MATTLGPNTFGGPATTPGSGSSASSGLPSYPGGFFPLYDPKFERANRRRFRRQFLPQLQMANSLYVPSGPYPARGWILMLRSDFLNINPYSVALQLQIDDFDNPPLTFNHLTVVQAHCVSTGQSGDPDSVYLVEITDKRGVLYAPWFQAPTTSAYNVLAPAYPADYYSLTENGGVPWTWDQMIGNLWGQMPLLGAYPGLPVVPTGTPQDWWLPGVSAWEALNRMLDLIGCVLTADLTSATPYGIADLNAEDFNFNANQLAFAHLLEDDLEYLDMGSGRVPFSVTVLFHRVNQYYGTEETIRRDSLQWGTTYAHAVTVQGPFPLARGTHYLWDDFAVRYDEDNQPLAADIATANTIARERAGDYFARTQRGTQGYLWQLYAGALPFATGSRTDGVAWRHDYHEDYRRGWVTEVLRGPQPPWPHVKVTVE